jgi:hypothetical protein
MNPQNLDPPIPPQASSEGDPSRHADKYSDPRVSITRRGILLGLGVLAFGIAGAALSIYGRRTQLEQSTEFWGQETITALQLAERIELLPRGSTRFDRVELSGTPGLGHLRHLLLDERSYDWLSQQVGSAIQDCGEAPTTAPTCVQLRLTDPNGKRIGVVEIDMDLRGGWIGPSDGSRRVRTDVRIQPKLANYVATIVSVEQKRYDLRDTEKASE